MFRRMAAAGDDPPVARADPQRLAVQQPHEADRHRAHHRSEAAPALRGLGGDPLLFPAGRTPIGEGLGRGRVADIGGQHPREQPFAAGHPQAHAEPLAKPAREAEMVRMEMGADHPGHRPPGQRACEHRLPSFARGGHVEAAVDQRDAVAIVEDPEIDMVQRARHRRARPADSIGQLDDRARLAARCGRADRLDPGANKARRERATRRASPAQLLKRVSALGSASAAVSPASAASAASASRAWASRSARNSSISASRSSLKVVSTGAAAPLAFAALATAASSSRCEVRPSVTGILRLDVGDIPVAAFADRLDGRARGADQLAESGRPKAPDGCGSARRRRPACPGAWKQACSAAPWYARPGRAPSASAACRPDRSAPSRSRQRQFAGAQRIAPGELGGGGIVGDRLHFQDVQAAKFGDLLEGERGVVDQPGGGRVRHERLGHYRISKNDEGRPMKERPTLPGI